MPYESEDINKIEKDLIKEQDEDGQLKGRREHYYTNG